MNRLYFKAAAVCRATPGRTGRLVQIADATDVLVAGDLHGQLQHFRRIFELAALGKHPRRHLVLQEVIHGPHAYPDGSDKSHQLLDLVAATIVQFPGRVHFLPGNHEFAQITNRPVAKANGDLNQLFRAGVDIAYGEHAELVYEGMTRLIEAAPLGVRTANRVFMSHSIPNGDAPWNAECLTAPVLPPESFAPGGDVYRLVWGRDLSSERVVRLLKQVDADLVVTGHIPCENGFQIPNEFQVVLDGQEAPAGYCLFPADRPITHAELVACAGTVSP
ncbi:MAG: metallophosphoesterase [Gemmataceae bacterium]|nr:metallophosphoesterase [Gemmataceae bacterium]